MVGEKSDEHSRHVPLSGACMQMNFLRFCRLRTLHQKWSRGQVEARLANLPPVPNRHGGLRRAHHLSRKLQMLGHDARLMPAKCSYFKG
jgi:hypothetical protein